MSPPFHERLRRAWYPQTLGLRLVLGYALLFAASTVVLSVLAYVLFIAFMREPDRAFVETQARELAAAYARGGLEGLRAELTSSVLAERREELLVRLADEEGRILLLYNPDDWQQAELEELAQQPVPERESWARLGPAADDDALGVFSVRLPEGPVLQVGTDTDIREDVLESMREVFFAIALPVLLLALLGGALMAYRALLPVRRLLLTLQTINATGDVHERVPVDDARGEFAALARLFNHMLDRIQVLLEGMRSTVDNVAHDLRTPMTHLRGTAELALQQERDPPAYRDALAHCLETSDVVLTMLDTLMDVSEAEAGTISLNRSSLHVSDLVADVADLYGFAAEQKGITLEAHVSPDLFVAGDASRLRRVVANLLDNAIKYTPPGGRVTLTGHRKERTCVLAVSDTGRGISENDLPRIWDRLYRGDQSRSERGLGLGLSLVRAIVEAHDGRVEVASTLGRGATFTVYLPCTPSPTTLT